MNAKLRGLIIIPLAVGLGLLLLRYDASAHMSAMVARMMAGALVIGLLNRIWQSVQRRPARTAKVDTVAICITKPVLPVPDIAEAYQRLPDYCQRLAGG